MQVVEQLDVGAADRFGIVQPDLEGEGPVDGDRSRRVVVAVAVADLGHGDLVSPPVAQRGRCALGVDDLITAATASIAALGNIGPGLGQVGANCTYAWMSPPAKLLLTLAMLLGRLELYTVLVLFVPAFYK